MNLPNNEGLKINTKSSIYGRNFRNDLTQFFDNLKYRDALAVFNAFEFIKNPKHLSEILKINLEDSLDRLECLENLNLISKTQDGYMIKDEDLIREPIKENISERKISHAEKLIQIAGKYPSSDKISDIHGVYCASEDSINLLKKDILNAIESFEKRNKETNAEAKNQLINLILGYTENSIKFNETNDGEI